MMMMLLPILMLCFDIEDDQAFCVAFILLEKVDYGELSYEKGIVKTYER